MRTARAKGDAAPTPKASMDPEVLDASRVVPFHKSLTTDRILFGVVFRPSVPDAHGDEADPTVVRKAAHDFLAGYGSDNTLSIQHADMDPPLSLVESYVAEEDGTPHGVQVLKGDWAIGVRVDDDDLWAKCTGDDREFTGFSIGGLAAMQQIAQEPEGTQEVAKSDSGEVKIEKAVATPKPKRLRKYLSASIQHIALVDAGANQLVHVPIAKRLQHMSDPKLPTQEAPPPIVTPDPPVPPIADPPVTPDPPAVAPVAKSKRVTPKRLAELKAIHASQAALIADMETAESEEETAETPAVAPVAKAAAIEAHVDLGAIVQEAVSKALAASDAKHAEALAAISKANAELKTQLDEFAAIRPISKSASGDTPTPPVTAAEPASVFQSLFTGKK